MQNCRDYSSLSYTERKQKLDHDFEFLTKLIEAKRAKLKSDHPEDAQIDVIVDDAIKRIGETHDETKQRMAGKIRNAQIDTEVNVKGMSKSMGKVAYQFYNDISQA